MWLRLKNVEKKTFVLFSSWGFQTPISSSRAPDPFLLLGYPGLLKLPRNWLSHLVGQREVCLLKSQRKLNLSPSSQPVLQHVSCVLSPASGAAAPSDTKARFVSTTLAISLLWAGCSWVWGAWGGLPCPLFSLCGLGSIGYSILSPYRSELMPRASNPWSGAAFITVVIFGR